MTSNKPYLIRAFYDWIVDNELTPYIVVDINVYGVLVPMAYVNDGKIVLNTSPSAVGHISLAGDEIHLSARFGGKLEQITVPFGAISAIYAKENGVGSGFEIEHPSIDEAATEAPAEDKPSLSVATHNDDDGENKTAAKASKRPSLTVVK